MQRSALPDSQRTGLEEPKRKKRKKKKLFLLKSDPTWKQNMGTKKRREKKRKEEKRREEKRREETQRRKRANSHNPQPIPDLPLRPSRKTLSHPLALPERLERLVIPEIETVDCPVEPGAPLLPQHPVSHAISLASALPADMHDRRGHGHRLGDVDRGPGLGVRVPWGRRVPDCNGWLWLWGGWVWWVRIWVAVVDLGLGGVQHELVVGVQNLKVDLVEW